jgi:chaperonin GroES
MVPLSKLVVVALAHGATAWMPRSTQPTRLTVRPAATYKLDDDIIGGPLEPCQNFILVKLGEQLTMMGGLFMPDAAQEDATEGAAVAVGPGRLHPDTNYLIPMPVEAGESVLFGQFDGVECDYCEAKHTLIQDTDVIFAWRGEKTLASVRLLGDQVLVEVTKKAEATTSGIVLSASASAQAKVSEGRVLRAGAGRLASSGVLAPMPISEGEYVKYRAYAGHQVSELNRILRVFSWPWCGPFFVFLLCTGTADWRKYLTTRRI